MARDSSIELNNLLKSVGAETSSTLQLTLRQPEVQLHLATARLNIGGVIYEHALHEVSFVRLSLEGADDFVELRLRNSGALIDKDPVAAVDALLGARAVYGLYWRDPNTGQPSHQTMLNGVVTSVQANRQIIVLTVAREAQLTQLITPAGTAQQQKSLVQVSTATFDPDTFRVSSPSAGESPRISTRGMPTGMLHVVYDFDAPNDGETDATAQIQAAIDAAAVAPFRTVYIPPGAFRVTQLVLRNDVAITGAGSYRTVIESVDNLPIINVETEAFRSSIRGLRVKGDPTKPGQVGLNLGGAGYYFGCFVEDVLIENCGSHGLLIREPFSSAFEKIRVSNCAGYPFLIDAPNRPNLVLRDCYAAVLRASAPAGYRIKSGYQVRLENCNGIDSIPPGAKWAVIGRKNGLDGDKTNEAAYVQFVSCNIESWSAVGVECLSNSTAQFESCYFAGDQSGNGAKIPIRYEVDSSLYPAFFAKGTIDDKTTFADGPLGNFSLGAAVHSNDLPPLMLAGQGPNVASDQPLSSYYDTTTKRKELLTRSDAFHKRTTVTASTAFSRPGVRLIEVNHSEPVTVTLPWPGWYRVGEPVTVIDAAGTADRHPITINASSGGTVNGGNYTLNKNRQTVILIPNNDVLDWRVVSDFAPGGAAPAPPGFAATVGRGSRTLDWSKAQTRQHTLTGDVTLQFANAAAGQLYALILVQDAIGGRTVNWPTNVKWPGGSAPDLSPAAIAKDVFQFVYTGSQWLNISQTFGLS